MPIAAIEAAKVRWSCGCAIPGASVRSTTTPQPLRPAGRARRHDLTAVAAELYQRLGMTLYTAADYPRAEQALDAALELCRADVAGAAELSLLSCHMYARRER